MATSKQAAGPSRSRTNSETRYTERQKPARTPTFCVSRGVRSKYDRIVGNRLLALGYIALTGCSLVLVREPKEAALRDPKLPPDCTTSNVAPLLDLVLGAAMGGGVAAVTYGAVEGFNDDCPNCYTPWKPAALAAFLVTSPWWIISAIGFSDTHRCRKLHNERGVPY
jgi:hypothetical protein